MSSSPEGCDCLDGSVGDHSTIEFVVTSEDSASALGSGDLAVLATPRLIAWCEAATCAAISGRMCERCTTVGTHIDFRHRAPTHVGSTVHVRAALTSISGSRLVFSVSTTNDGGVEIARGTVTRVRVNRADFMAFT